MVFDTSERRELLQDFLWVQVRLLQLLYDLDVVTVLECLRRRNKGSTTVTYHIAAIYCSLENSAKVTTADIVRWKRET